MSSDSRRTSRCFSWMSLNQSTSMSSSRPSGSRRPQGRGWLQVPSSEDALAVRESPGHPPGPAPGPSQQPSNHSRRCAASPPAEPRGAPGRPAGARWCPPLRGCPPQGCTGRPGPARQRPGHHPSCPSAARSFPTSPASSGQRGPRAWALPHTLGAEARPLGGEESVWHSRNPSMPGPGTDRGTQRQAQPPVSRGGPAPSTAAPQMISQCERVTLLRR